MRRLRLEIEVILPAVDERAFEHVLRRGERGVGIAAPDVPRLADEALRRDGLVDGEDRRQLLDVDLDRPLRRRGSASRDSAAMTTIGWPMNVHDSSASSGSSCMIGPKTVVGEVAIRVERHRRRAACAASPKSMRADARVRERAPDEIDDQLAAASAACRRCRSTRRSRDRGRSRAERLLPT